MGLRQIIKGIDGSLQNIGYSAAVPNGLKFINFFGGDISQARNLASGGVASIVVGSPTVGTMAEGILCTSHASYIQTAVPQSSRMTLMGVFTPTSDSRAYAMSNANGARPIGLSVYSEPSGAAGTQNLRVQIGGVLATGGTNGTAGAAVSNAITNNVPFAFAATIDYSNLAATKVVIKALKSGTGNTGTTAFSAIGTGASGMLIGSDLDSTTYAGTRIWAGAVWDRVLTDSEIATQYTQIKNYYFNVHGISV